MDVQTWESLLARLSDESPVEAALLRQASEVEVAGGKVRIVIPFDEEAPLHVLDDEHRRKRLGEIFCEVMKKAVTVSVEVQYPDPEPEEEEEASESPRKYDSLGELQSEEVGYEYVFKTPADLPADASPLHPFWERERRRARMLDQMQ